MNVNIVGENQGVNVQERSKEEEEINTNESELSGILITKMNWEMNQELFWESFDKSYKHEGLENEEAYDDPENCLVVERVKKVVATKKSHQTWRMLNGREVGKANKTKENIEPKN